MKKRTATAAFVFAVLGWSSALALDLPSLCGGFEVLSNPDTRVYRGQFERNGVFLPTALVVVEVSESDNALLFYAHGEQPQWGINYEGCYPHDGTVSGDRVLSVPIDGRTVLVYTFDREGGVVLEWVSGGQTTFRGTLSLEELPLPRQHELPLVMEASNNLQQGFVRIINRSNRSGFVAIHAIDDTGERFGPLQLEMTSKETLHFNSEDLEEGNDDKGLAVGVGDGEGNWRLRLTSDLDIKALAYVRTPDGFVTSIHETAVEAREGLRYDVPFFNPGKNRRQQSRLRLSNPNTNSASIEVKGLDDKGQVPPGGTVHLTLAPGASTLLTAEDLEQGADHFTGRFGVGTGKWQLFILADRQIRVMSLLLSPTGNLTNLSR